MAAGLGGGDKNLMKRLIVGSLLYLSACAYRDIQIVRSQIPGHPRCAEVWIGGRHGALCPNCDLCPPGDKPCWKDMPFKKAVGKGGMPEECAR
jgi:hypothetical protein